MAANAHVGRAQDGVPSVAEETDRSPFDADKVRLQIRRWQERLLDLSRSNPLINLNRSRVSKLRVAKPDAQNLFTRLIIEEAEVRMPLVRKQVTGAGEPIPVDDAELERRFRVDPGDVEFDLPPLDLFRKLRRVYDNGRTTVEERGVTTLHLTLGTLRWRDDHLGETVSPLWMVPCRLERKGPNAPLRLQLSDEEMRLNPALEYYLRERHKIHLPPVPDEPDEKSLDMFLADFTAAVREHDWTVEPEVWLSTFMFESLVIYQDLKELTEAATANPIVAALSRAGTRADGSEALGDDLDALPTPDVVPIPILPADSSQLKALAQVASHRNVVIHGPPGTGKSQTIANLIADALGRNGKVLFVSAKMAALNVVHDRLKKDGLARFCLEAHSTKAGKAKVIDELRRTHDMETAGDGGRLDEELANLLKTRTHLNAYVRELHKRHEPLGRTPYQVIGKLANLTKTPDIRAPLPWRDACSVQRADLEACCDALDALGQTHEVFDNRTAHPWRGYDPADGSALDREDVEADLQLAGTACRGILENLKAVSTLIPRQQDLTVTELELFRPALEAVRGVERLPHDWWTRSTDELETSARTLGAGADYVTEQQSKRTEYEKALDLPIQEGRDLLNPAKVQFRAWYRIVLPAYWSWRSAVVAKLRPNASKSFRAMVSYLHLSQRLIEIEEWLRSHDQELSRATGGQRSPTELKAASGQAHAAGLLQSALKASLREPIPGTVEVSGKMRAAMGNLIENGVSSSAKLSDALKRIDSQWPTGFIDGSAVTHASCARLNERISEVLQGAPRFREWRLMQTSLKQCYDVGLGPFVEGLKSVSAKEARAAFEKRFYRLWATSILESSPTLSRFSESNQRDLIQKFRMLDERLSRLAVRRIQAVAAQPARMIRGAGGNPGNASEVGKLRIELQKTKRLKPLRKLFAEIPHVLQALKPCMLMSPISVSTYLKPGAFRFDLVVFDEASQLPTPEAVASILRADNVVVAGDAKQLPPTSFFSAAIVHDDDIPDGDEEVPEAPLDSLLDDCVAVVPVFEETRLKWHYRSRDERLIKFSNHYFYDNNLVTFPAPFSGNDGRGVRLIHVPDGIWDRGRSRTNRREARIVAQRVVENLERFPERSIGVAAMNSYQREAIEDAINEELQSRPDLMPLVDGNRDEPFFVKSLENVQGDERDTIIISVGYGKDANGSLALNFGPLNLEGGWRRLNVLVTRAKWQTIIVTSMRSHDLQGVNPNNRGAVALKNFIEYAERGAELPPAPTTITDGETNDFEDGVCTALQERGLKVDQQVGASYFKIDLAVRDRRDPTRYVLGIECDGATYHGSPTARDRDLLRQQVLRQMGWRLHRVWSTEWFHDPERAILSILRSLEQAEANPLDESVPAPASVASSDRLESESKSHAVSSVETISQPATTTAPHRYPGGTPYRLYQSANHRSNRDVLLKDSLGGLLVRDVAAIVDAESPIHKDLLTERLKELHGVARAGVNINANIERAIRYLIRGQRVIHGRDKKFLYGVSGSLAQFRVPTDDMRRPLEWIAPEEIELAILHIVEDQFGMSRDHIPQAVARTFGIDRLSAANADLLRATVDEMIERGTLRTSGPNAYIA